MAVESDELVALLSALRGAIQSSQKQLKESGNDAILRIDKVEAEIRFVVGEKIGAEAGLNIQIARVGAGAEHRTENVHTLRLILIPMGSVEIAGQNSGPPPNSINRG